jgi:hypothetical protein
MRLGTEAELRAVSAPPSDLPALHVLAATARSLHHLLAEARHGRPGEGDARVRDAHRRVSRMERWLAERAEHDRDAGAAADVALWVLDHLERRRG